ncbi:MAG: dTDP-4-dehydrorhamnose 3,5-epimerase family protein [Thermoguttaceae bacterium]|jgi:dTDP-4-dehydrorhamnose 3,5-epimerase
MFHEGPIDGVIFRPLKPYGDQRGWLIELVREDELPGEHRPVMTYLSMTLPGVVRGPHEHRRQADLFAFVGPGDFKLYLWDARRDSPTYGNRQIAVVGQSNRRAVLVPPGVVHAYRNTSDVPGLVLNAPNRLYAGWGRNEPVDEIRYENLADTPYRLEE